MDKGRNKEEKRKKHLKEGEYIMKKELKNETIIIEKSSFLITGKRERIKGKVRENETLDKV